MELKTAQTIPSKLKTTIDLVTLPFTTQMITANISNFGIHNFFSSLNASIPR